VIDVRLVHLLAIDDQGVMAAKVSATVVDRFTIARRFDSSEKFGRRLISEARNICFHVCDSLLTRS